MKNFFNLNNIYNIIYKEEKILKFFLRIIIIFVWTYLLYNGNITYERLILFIYVFLFIYIYIYILKFIEVGLMKYFTKIFGKKKFLLIQTIYFLIILNIFKNPIIFILYYIDFMLFNFFNKLNYKLLNYKFFSFFLIFTINNLLINPIKLIIEMFYNWINKLKNLSFLDLLFKRIEGLIFSILIFTDINKKIVGFLMHLGYFYIFIYTYIFLIFLCILIQLIKYKKYTFNTLILIELNKKVTILGNIIRNLIMLAHELHGKKYNWNMRYRYFFSLFEMPNSLLFEWEKRKITIVSNVYLMSNEILYEPNLYLYRLLFQSLHNPGCNIMHWKYYKNKKSLNKYTMEEEKIINDMYDFDLQRIKFLLFLIWDFEYSAGLIDANNVFIDNIGGMYVLKFNCTVYDLLMIRKNKGIFLKKNEEYNILFNIEDNINFWNKWYDIMESYLSLPKDNIIDIRLEYDKNYYKLIDDLRFKYDFERAMEEDTDENEEKLKIWMSNLIEEWRVDWKKNILFNKNKQAFYWTFLNNIEKILKKNEK